MPILHPINPYPPVGNRSVSGGLPAGVRVRPPVMSVRGWGVYGV